MQDGSSGTARLETPAPIRLVLLPDSPWHPGMQAAFAWPCQQQRLLPMLPVYLGKSLSILDLRAQIG